MECFVLLSIMMNSQQPINEEDINEAIKAYGDNPSFLKKILEGSKTRKKVENFLGQQQMTAMHDYQKDPEIIKNINEIIHNPLFDKDSRTEAQRQLLRINQGLPRFP